MTSLPAAAAFRPDPIGGAQPSPNNKAEAAGDRPTDGQRLQRSAGMVDIGFKLDHGVTRLDRAFQSGCGRVRLPRQHDVPWPTGVLINTAGGLTGGDTFKVKAELQAGTRAILTSQAAEKIYRSRGDAAEVDNVIALGPRARLDWLPQETILFDRSSLRRRTTVTMAADATLTATELVVFGRSAMDETVLTGALLDSWRIARDGRVVFADATRISGPVQSVLNKKAAAAGSTALALVLHVAPDAHERCDAVRAILADEDRVRAGASAYDGLLVVRMVAPAAQALRQCVLRVMAEMRDKLPPPRPWLL